MWNSISMDLIPEPCLYKKKKKKNPPYYRQIHAYWGSTQSVLQKKHPKTNLHHLEETKEKMVLNRTGDKVTPGHKFSLTSNYNRHKGHILMAHTGSYAKLWKKKKKLDDSEIRFPMRWETKMCISLSPQGLTAALSILPSKGLTQHFSCSVGPSRNGPEKTSP